MVRQMERNTPAAVVTKLSNSPRREWPILSEPSGFVHNRDFYSTRSMHYRVFDCSYELESWHCPGLTMSFLPASEPRSHSFTPTVGPSIGVFTNIFCFAGTTSSKGYAPFQRLSFLVKQSPALELDLHTGDHPVKNNSRTSRQ